MRKISNKKYEEGGLIFWKLKRHKSLKEYGIIICYSNSEPRPYTALRLKEARQHLKDCTNELNQTRIR